MTPAQKSQKISELMKGIMKNSATNHHGLSIEERETLIAGSERLRKQIKELNNE